MSESDREKIAKDCFAKGVEAMAKENWDYSISMFTQAVSFAKDNLVYRQTRHGCIRKKFGDNGTGARMASMKLMGIRGKLKKGRMKKDWDHIDTLVEEGMGVNPWDPGLFFELGEACLEREQEPRQFESIARYALIEAVNLSPETIPYNRRLGNLLFERSEYDDAWKCFERIYKQDPNDSDARKKMGEIDTQKVMHRGKYEEAESTKEVKVEQKPKNAYEEDRQARKGQSSVDGPGQSEEADLQRMVRKEPKNVNMYLRLADFYRNKKRLKESLKTYQEALEACGESAAIGEPMEDVELEVLRNDLANAKEQSRAKPSNEFFKEKSGKLAKQLLKREIEILGSRIDQYPNDMRLKFELGQRYKRANQINKAIPLFQQASADTRIKEDVLVALGECFIKDKKLDLGRRQFEKAVQTIDGLEKPEQFKTAHYWLGRLYEKAGQVDQAENHYTEILAVDYEYKDVRARLEKMSGEEEGSLDD